MPHNSFENYPMSWRPVLKIGTEPLYIRLAAQLENDIASASLSRWLCLPDGVTGEQFERLALEHGVFVYGAERFAVGKDAPPGAARLAICAPESTGELEHGLVILKELLFCAMKNCM